MLNKKFWNEKKVFVTGHTGFKGSWLCLWLHYLGANITGYSLSPPTNPNLFDLCKINDITNTVIGDIRNYTLLNNVISDFDPDIIIHLAAQPLVRESYSNPIETYETNVLGTVNVFEAVRALSTKSNKKRVIVNVTSDKCYENKEWLWGYREDDKLGGFDPYSNSKACSELVTSCYLQSFFYRNNQYGIALASARAGNVIGGGDFAKDRLLPDCVRSCLDKTEIIIRNPNSLRPWQHVLEPLSGYLLLAEKLYNDGYLYQGSWNFGPSEKDTLTVNTIVDIFLKQWGESAYIKIEGENATHEAKILKLDCSKAKQLLGWEQRWDIDEAINKVVLWTRAFINKQNLKKVCLEQIEEFELKSKQ
ncbi:CDP-glucose 4,6-dehydratase [Neobacillus terrae]|uniref:CDP-glucose 4,6-dehydratase n=1 Tax=Neobacillus terrae TaxID=3034837 RepID=UPI00140C6058|nr:CDP-glucose 4,6-dehydratase [Neobacillus terrae]NHM31128.1 CDP-glucose 4,6-dehydratase [Neobacillus terrae]